MQDYVFYVYDKQEKFEKKKKIYTEANKKLQVDITELEGKNIHLIFENACLVAEVTKIKDLCYLNESRQGIGGVDRVGTNSSTDNIQYPQLPTKVEQSTKLENFPQFDGSNMGVDD